MATTPIRIERDDTSIAERAALGRLIRMKEELIDSGLAEEGIALRDLVIRTSEEYILIQEYRRVAIEQVRKKAQSLLSRDQSK